MSAMTPVDPLQAIMFAQYDSEGGPLTPKKFYAKGSVTEGVSGRHMIDTSFENTDYQLVKGEINPGEKY